ncbi:MAG TPA: hypothetical protein VGO59_14675 [Verrucomicrobiae bacterium]
MKTMLFADAGDMLGGLAIPAMLFLLLMAAHRRPFASSPKQAENKHRILIEKSGGDSRGIEFLFTNAFRGGRMPSQLGLNIHALIDYDESSCSNWNRCLRPVLHGGAGLGT